MRFYKILSVKSFDNKRQTPGECKGIEDPGAFFFFFFLLPEIRCWR